VNIFNCIVIFIIFQITVNNSIGQKFYTSFSTGKWNPSEWILVKSPRWDHFGGWIQRDYFIENEIPPGSKPEELIGKYAHKTYTSMVLNRKFNLNITISSTMEFADRMAPIIVIAPDLGKDKKGRNEYREHFEIAIFDQGVNVWHHYFKDGKPSWKKAAYFRFKLKPNTKYTLKTKLTQQKTSKMLSVFVDGHEMGYIDDLLPNNFYVGITGCEGINRFYDFHVEK